MKKLIIQIIVVVALVGAFVVLNKFDNQKNKPFTITTYEECVEAGYPVDNSGMMVDGPWIPGCKTPDGRIFYSQDVRCALLPRSGSCKARFTRYYFDQNEGICKEFIWGGCYEGVVPFETLNECQQACEK